MNVTLIVGCGYLGRRVGTQRLQQGKRVLGTAQSENRAAELAALGFEPVIANVLDPTTLDRLPAADRVFYAVGFNRSSGASMRSVYVDGLQNVLDRLPDAVNRFVLASSTGVYGQTSGEWVNEDSTTEPTHESGRIVLEAEHRVRDWASGRGVSAVVLRFAGLYGPGRVVRRQMLERGDPIPGDPEKFLNLVHIEDAARAAVGALDADDPDPIYLVADDRPVHRREYYQTAARVLGAPEPRFEVPQPGTPESARDATNKRINNQRMKTRLGVALAFPEIHSGLADALGYPDRAE